MRRVEVRRWVVDDLAWAVRSRSTLGTILLDLNNRPPKTLAVYQSKRVPGSPRCFWYDRLFVNGSKLQGFNFVVQDADLALLDMIWVIPTA